MPISYKIDSGRKVIFVALEGAITDEQVMANQDALRSDPAFEASFKRFIDCSGITQWNVTASAIQRAAIRVKGDTGRQTAIFAPQDMSFGTARCLKP